MSILIKGMEMPTDVTLLAISSDGTVDIISGQLDLSWETLKDKAICVPPHGRLGDLDDFAKRMKSFVEKAENDEFDLGAVWYSTFVRLIELTPTVIPAEEGE